jgi:hypothetical protein
LQCPGLLLLFVPSIIVYNCWVVCNEAIVEADVSVGSVCVNEQFIHLTTSVCQDPCFAVLEPRRIRPGFSYDP